jgi:Trypsin-co-occurring domain 2
MNVKTFISETLRQIVEGIHEAQTADGGTTVNTRLVSGTPGGHLVHDGRNMFTRVDFDIAISAETSGGGKGSLRVWIASAEGGGEQKSESANRIRFSIPVQLPDASYATQ